MIAAMLSSLSSIYNSAGALFTLDLYKKHINPGASQEQMVKAGQLWQIAMTILTFLWIPVLVGSKSSFFLFVQDVMGHVTPPLAALFISGVCLPRVNNEGGLVGVVLGTTIGVLRFLSRAVATLAAPNQNICAVHIEDVHPSPTGTQRDLQGSTTTTSSPGPIVLLKDSWWFCTPFFLFALELFLFSLAL